MTLSNKNAMVQSCQEKFELYENFISRNQIIFDQVPWALIDNGSVFSRQTLEGHDEINDLAIRINFIEHQLR